MTPLAAVLALALVAGPSPSPRRTGQDVSNAARAKAGLLPRKAARTRTAVGAGYRVVRMPSPTFLPEPAPLADDAPPADGAVAEAAPGEDAPVAGTASGREPSGPEEPVALRAPELIAERSAGVVEAPAGAAPAAADPADGVDEPLVAARGPTVTRTLGSVGPADPSDAVDDAAAESPAPPPAPDGFGAVQASAQGVVTEVTLSLRFDP